MDIIFKILIIILLFTILGFNIITFIKTTGNTIIDGGNVIIKEGERDINNIIKTIEKPLNNSAFEPDDNSIRKNKYCYVGSDRGNRSCVEMDDDICQSNEVYHTKNICLNPRLRL